MYRDQRSALMARVAELEKEPGRREERIADLGPAVAGLPRYDLK